MQAGWLGVPVPEVSGPGCRRLRSAGADHCRRARASAAYTRAHGGQHLPAPAQPATPAGRRYPFCRLDWPHRSSRRQPPKDPAFLERAASAAARRHTSLSGPWSCYDDRRGAGNKSIPDQPVECATAAPQSVQAIERSSRLIPSANSTSGGSKLRTIHPSPSNP